MSSNDVRRTTLRPPPGDERAASTKMSGRPSPRSFLAAGALDALEQLCTGGIPATDSERETMPGSVMPPIPSDAPTVRQLPGDAE